ncbi:hypothetical protein HY967_04855 [Candidatus Jorgensenbacteria bacterium]|nr:hypothetical protein [Candidatus Jorgensenbacteria bacterium]
MFRWFLGVVTVFVVLALGILLCGCTSSKQVVIEDDIFLSQTLTKEESFADYTMQIPQSMREDTTVMYMHGGRKFVDGVCRVEFARGWWGKESFYDPEWSRALYATYSHEMINGMKCFMVMYRDASSCYIAIWPYGSRICVSADSKDPNDLDRLFVILRTFRKKH